MKQYAIILRKHYINFKTKYFSEWKKPNKFKSIRKISARQNFGTVHVSAKTVAAAAKLDFRYSKCQNLKQVRVTLRHAPVFLAPPSFNACAPAPLRRQEKLFTGKNHDWREQRAPISRAYQLRSSNSEILNEIFSPTQRNTRILWNLRLIKNSREVLGISDEILR